jgi:hypothetical protein
VRTEGRDSVVFILPVGGTMCFVDLSRGGNCAGIGSIKGKGADGFDASVRSCAIANDREQLVDILVLLRKDEAEIFVGVDEKPLLHWAGPVSGLYERGDWRVLDMRCPALGVRDSSVEYRKVQIRSLSDSARPPADAPWAKPSGPAE